MTNITNILQQGETEAVEFKTSFSKAVIETLVAFANTKGGVVYVGVKDSGEVVGLTLETESLQKWSNEIKQKTEPSIIPNTEIYTVYGKTIVAIQVQEYPVKPIAVQGKYYRRIKGANHLMNAMDIADLYIQSMQYSWDAYPYPKATYADLNEDKIKDFIIKVNRSGRFELPDEPIKALIKLNLLKEEVPTNAAMLLFSKQNLLYNVHIGRFKTPSLIIADNMINGNLYDVVEKSMQYIISHIKFAFEITGNTTQRTEIPEYPLDAIRELLLNTIIHRNYQSPTDIQIKIFDNYINFFNPSGLYGDITVEDLKTDTYRASTRNKLIAEAFYLTKDIEKYGSGFTRIRKEIKHYPTMTFLYENRTYGFFTELRYVEQRTKTNTKELGKELGKESNKNLLVKEKWQDNILDVTDNVTNNVTDNVTNNVTDRSVLIIQMIKENKFITTKKLAGNLKVSRRTVLRDIEKLKIKGVLERIGDEKSGYWQIIRDEK